MLRPATGEAANPRMGRSGVAAGVPSALPADLVPRPVAPAALPAALESLLPSLLVSLLASLPAPLSPSLPESLVVSLLVSLAFACRADVRARLAGSSCLATCFCFSSASSDWMRCSIFSIFFRRMSLASPSTAKATPPVKVDSAVAARNRLHSVSIAGSSNFRRSGARREKTQRHGDPQTAEIGTPRRYVANTTGARFEKRRRLRNWNLSNVRV